MPTLKKRSAASQDSSVAPSSVLRRSAMIGIILAVLLALAGLISYLTRSEAPQPRADAHPKPTASPPSPAPRAGSDQAVAAPPRTGDPVTFAKAATEALWTYDARRFSRAGHLAGLKRWMTGEAKYADWKSVTGQVPGKALWSRMHDNHQHATAEVNEGHYPAAFKTVLSQDPGAITQSYVYAVTVTGKQSLAWKGSGAGAEPRSMTLALQCRPDHECALSGVLPEVAP
ncbi:MULTISPECIES: hypothetical protein [unclassified Streptomyces]|uniref:hypothetical protein n=1 Tax=unclassified Streptomyces TaxID=2593676 RepID=UPI002DDB0009|nr:MULTISPECIES: hypothetical protein [unclassified Streptomyces]WSA96700.1 hypothetical protein OIE63_37995 [Streptomyces sp. NBC_01795]WSB81115.1 hypothetical protein OHB04_39115 [Streptomyces sp. NBC_01775]WSS10673.1 hypothetical protein OG533_01145 [Streptomyces sp. NBC_01186]WSS39370.1 hypothetical protein OG220_01170 [Streptomyces sp. NBC_01187]